MNVFISYIDEDGIVDHLDHAHRTMDEAKAMWYLFLIEQMSQIGEEMTEFDWSSIVVDTDESGAFSFTYDGVCYTTEMMQLVG